MTSEAAPAAWRARAGQGIARRLLPALYAASAHHTQRVPARGPVVLAANHTGFLDGPLLVALSPRPVHVLVLDRTFTGWVGPVMRMSGQIPINQRVGDRVALGKALEVLGRGGVVGIFPEGGRGRGDVAAAGKGVAWIAQRAGAPVVPVACLGTRHTGELAGTLPPLRRRVVLDIGEPVDVTPPDGLNGRARLEHGAHVVQQALAAHVAQASTEHGIALPTDIPPDLLPA